MLLLSTAIYVSESELNSPFLETEANMELSAHRLSITHTVMSALASISNGGDVSILTEDLNKIKFIVANHTFNALLNIEFTPLNQTPYQNGIYTSWGVDGIGVTSACVDVALNSSGISATYYSEYAVNITSEINVSGYYTRLTGALKQVNVTCNLLNEDTPSLARNFILYYEADGSLSSEEWVPVTSPNITNYGNGTYLISFAAETKNRNDPLLFSVNCHDLRYIFVRANATGTLV
jgi:hypothetical protein